MSDDFAAALQSGDADAAQKLWDGPKADDKPEAPKQEVAPTPQEDPGRARNADGTFAPRTEAPAVAEPPQPFEGFKDLPPEVQAQFNRLRGEADDYRLRYTRQLGHTRQLARSASASPQAPAGTAARQAASGLAPGPQRQAAQAQIEKWEAHAKAYPDEAAAVTELLTAYAAQIEQGINPLQQELAALKAQVGDIGEIRSAYQAFQDQQNEIRAREGQEELSRVGGDNWKQIAGWEDDNGNPVPPEKRTWHPEFRAWVEGHDPDEQEHIWSTLANPSPKVSGIPFRTFNQERFALEAQPTPAMSTQTRRQEALRDIQPGAARTAVSAATTWRPSGDAYVDAIRSGGYEEWKKA